MTDKPTSHEQEQTLTLEERYQFRGSLTFVKLLEYLPAMILTNISTLLLITVDGLVAGNLVGENALSSVSVFSPVSTVIGAITAVFSIGISTVLSLRMGDADPAKIMRAKKSVKTLTVWATVLISLLQIPVIYGMVYSYGLSQEMQSLVMSYAAGLMISTPFSFISTIGTYEMQIMGRMKLLMKLSVTEGLTNLILDVLFAGVLDLGVAGIGFGTATACTLRCILTVVCLYRTTDIYKTVDARASLDDIKEIISKGIPDASYMLVVAFQNYVMLRILFMYFGDAGGSIKGVCTFCYSLTNVLMSSVQGSVRPLVGLMSGAENKKGVRDLMQQGMLLIVALSGLLVLFIEVKPELFYYLHGVTKIPQGGESSLRYYALCITLLGINALFRMYFSNRGLQRFTTILTLAGNSTMPLFAYALGSFCEAPAIWLSYSFSAALILLINLVMYIRQIHKDNSTERDDIKRVYLSVKPENALEASKMIQNYASENGYPLRLANRARLCLEEMVAYSVKASGRKEVTNQIIVCFSGEEVIFMMLDNGECIVFDEDKEKQDMITDNYAMLKQIAKSVQYQYVLNMNHTIVRFA